MSSKQVVKWIIDTERTLMVRNSKLAVSAVKKVTKPDKNKLDGDINAKK